MNAEQYAKAKELFFELLDKPVAQREERLSKLSRESPEIAQEVRLLFANHNSRTIVGPTVHSGGTRSTTKSLLSLNIKKIHHWFVGGILPISIALVSTLIILALGLYLRREMAQRGEADYRTVLKSLASQKVKRIHQWSEAYQLRVSDWGNDPQLQRMVKGLQAICQNSSPVELSMKLRNAEEQREVHCVFDHIASRPLRIEGGDPTRNERITSDIKYAIWNSNFQLLADWQVRSNEKIALGEVASMTGKSVLSRVFETKSTHVVLPRPTDETISKDYPMEIRDQYVMIFVPVFEPVEEPEANPSFTSPQVMGAMMVRSSIFIDELRGILGDTVLPDSHCYLVDSSGIIASEVPDLKTLEALPEWQDINSLRKQNRVIHCLDPGVDLISGAQVLDDPISWNPTLAARGIMLKRDGDNVTGYRDFRGVNVVGAWQWMEDVDIGLVLEVPRSSAFRNLEFVSKAFLALLSIPLGSAIALIGVSFFRKLRDVEFTNRSVGQYRLNKKIGEGGLGVVYRAMHKSLQRPAAVKLIKPGVINPSTMKRFEREVRLAASFDHPHAVHIYDYGVSKDGFVFCAMQLVEGATLAQIMSFSGYMPLARSLHFMCQIADALAEAHNLGLVHRDVKPQNVMVCNNAPRDSVKVVDFGLAKNIASTISRDATATRIVMGTPGFIAPERLESPWIADPRIDTFSFGVLAIYLLTGQVPPMGVTRAGLVDSLQSSPVSVELRSESFQELLTLLVECVSTVPEERPSSMHDIFVTLSRIAIMYPWSAEEADKWWNENGATLNRWVETSHKDKKSRTTKH